MVELLYIHLNCQSGLFLCFEVLFRRLMHGV